MGPLGLKKKRSRKEKKPVNAADKKRGGKGWDRVGNGFTLLRKDGKIQSRKHAESRAFSGRRVRKCRSLFPKGRARLKLPRNRNPET